MNCSTHPVLDVMSQGHVSFTRHRKKALHNVTTFLNINLYDVDRRDRFFLSNCSGASRLRYHIGLIDLTEIRRRKFYSYLPGLEDSISLLG